MKNIKHVTYRATPIHVITNTKNGACLLFDRKGLGINSSRWQTGFSLHPLKNIFRSLKNPQKRIPKNLFGFSSALSATQR